MNLPKTNTPVYLKVYVDGVENRDLRTNEIIPNQRPQYDFTLEGTGTSTVTEAMWSFIARSKTSKSGN